MTTTEEKIIEASILEFSEVSAKAQLDNVPMIGK